MRSALITGGAGFIGSHLAERLLGDGWEVHILDDLSRQYSNLKVSTIHMESSLRHSKKMALFIGIKAASNELLLLTDADCQPQPGRIKTLLSYYDDNIALISGFTIMDKARPGMLDKLQKLDMIYLQSMAHMASNISRPVTMLGNNITSPR